MNSLFFISIPLSTVVSYAIFYLTMRYETKQKIINELFARTTMGINFGLDRIIAAMDSIGNPHRDVNCIHVAGTNGKGSVCAYLDSILRCKGCSTGLFTSPPIHDFEERFVINGLKVNSDDWLNVYSSIRKEIDRYSLTFFEISVILAFMLFKKHEVDWAIIETGLGGRLDATNIIKPKLSIITNIGIDHTDYLGSTISDIAQEKLGIVKSTIPLVLAVQQEPIIKNLAQKVCEERNSPLSLCLEEEAENIKRHDLGSSFTYHNTDYVVPLYGTYQVMNALCALNAAKLLGINDRPILIEGLKKTTIPGRFQVLTIRGKRIILDCAHNPQATHCLCQMLSTYCPHESISIITGIMADKDTQKMLVEYSNCAHTLILTHPNTPRAADPNQLYQKTPSRIKPTSIIIPSVRESVVYALKQPQEVICVTGSFYTIGEAMSCLEISPYD